jgi:hypothetical protein
MEDKHALKLKTAEEIEELTEKKNRIGQEIFFVVDFD